MYQMTLGGGHIGIIMSLKITSRWNKPFHSKILALEI